MDLSPQHRRQSIRLRGYDYTQAGAYFITVCVQGRECLFGEIAAGTFTPSNAGRMIEQWWLELPNKYRPVETDAFVVMPNHIHGIILIGDTASQDKEADEAVSLSRVVQWFKTMTTSTYICGVKQEGWRPFQGRLWQRNYYERIIRNEDERQRVRQYITDNPLQWAVDEENPMVDQAGRILLRM